MKRKSGASSTATSSSTASAAAADDASSHAAATLAARVDAVDAPPKADAAVLSSQPPPAKKKRMTQPVGNLTNAQKRMLCVKFAQVKMTQQELCVWAKDEFGLVNLPHQSTISKILARAGELTTMPSKDLLSRRKGFVTHPELDTALCNWVLYARQNNMKLSGDIIKDKARQLALTFGITSKMTFSNGWLGGFKKRHNIRLGGTTTTTTSASASASSGSMSATMTTNHAIAAGGLGNTMPTQPTSLSGVTTLPDGSPAVGAIAFANDPANAFAQMNTAAAAAASTIPFAIRELQEVAKLYHVSDIFTMSETGLFYSLSPEKPSGRGVSTPASAAARKRLTVALAANADGSERLEPFFIGNSKLPARLLQSGLDGEEPVQFQYRDNRKAWMTPVLFQEWIGLLDTKLRDDQRSILLLIAHAPSHIRIGLELTNIRLEMLPPSTTNQYQPFEAGIFEAFKRRYRRHHLHHALDRFEAELQDDIFQIDILQAMRWVRECWISVPPVLLKHYWDTTEITTAPKPSPHAYHAIEDMELKIENEICDVVASLPITRPMTIEEFLSPGDENMSLHCLGADESDFIHSVGGSSEKDFDAERIANDLKLMEAAAGGEFGGAAAGALNGGALMASAGGVAAAYAAIQYGSRTTNEQLIESFKVLLPELDRLRFDEHTKNSIRLAFRKLKEKETEQAAEAKQRQATRKAMMPGSAVAAQTSTSTSAASATAAAGVVELELMPPAVPSQSASTAAQLLAADDDDVVTTVI